MGNQIATAFFGYACLPGVAMHIVLALELFQFSMAENKNNNRQAQDVKEWCNAVLKSDFKQDYMPAVETVACSGMRFL